MRGPVAGLARLALVLSLAAGLGCGEPSSDTRPNVLLVIVDTLRADYLSSYGFPLTTSPNVDALAEQGVVFERAIAAATATTPSHASIMTSRYTREHSVGWHNGDTKLEGLTTLADVFRDAGYATAAFVGNVVLRRGLGFERGFDVYDDELPTAERNRPFVFERIAEDTTARALQWLDGVGGAPFFLWVHYQDPHGPYAPPEAYAGRFRIPPRQGERALPVLGDGSGKDGIPLYQALPGLARPSEYEGRYADEIFYADHWIGRLLAAVDAHPSGRSAIVLFTSDHGESMGESQRYFVHGFTSTPGEAHVPMILRAPNLAAERRPETVSHVDVMPTLLELAGLDAPPGLRGLALGPLLRDKRPISERLVYCDIGPELSAYTKGGFVRVGPVGDAWDENGESAASEVRRQWAAYAWRTGERWSPRKDRFALRQAIQSYFRNAVPMARAAPPGPEIVERLRALGYFDD